MLGAGVLCSIQAQKLAQYRCGIYSSLLSLKDVVVLHSCCGMGALCTFLGLHLGIGSVGRFLSLSCVSSLKLQNQEQMIWLSVVSES